MRRHRLSIRKTKRLARRHALPAERRLRLDGREQDRLLDPCGLQDAEDAHGFVRGYESKIFMDKDVRYAKATSSARAVPEDL